MRVIAQGLAKSYGDRPVLHDVSFALESGRVTGFLGPNGAGKTTTIRLMLELESGRGQTLFGGTRFSDLRNPARQVGVVLDGNSEHNARSAWWHLRCMARAASIPKKRVDEVLGLVGLADVAGRSPATFSHGMKQRLRLACALMGDPSLLVLDEPTNGLDPVAVIWLRDFLRSYALAGGTVFLSSHALTEVSLLADQLVVISKGKCVAAGSTESVMLGGTERSVIVRCSDPHLLAQHLGARGARMVMLPNGSLEVGHLDSEAIGQVCLALGLVVSQMTSKTPSLEEVFVRLTEGR